MPCMDQQMSGGPSPLEPVPGAAQPNQKCERLSPDMFRSEVTDTQTGFRFSKSN